MPAGCLVGDDRLFHRGHGVLDLDRRRFALGVGLNHLLGHLVLDVGKGDGGRVLLGDPLVNQGPVAGAKVAERPNGGQGHVEPPAVELGAGVRAAAEDTAVESSRRVRCLP